MNDNEIILTIGELRSEIVCLTKAVLIILKHNGASGAELLSDRDRVAYNVITGMASELAEIIHRIEGELKEFKRRSDEWAG